MDELKQVGKWDWFTQAPYIIAVVSKASDAWTRYDGKNLGDIDATIVMDHIILEATDEYEPVLLTPLGYPNAQPRGTGRKSIEELVEFI